MLKICFQPSHKQQISKLPSALAGTFILFNIRNVKSEMLFFARKNTICACLNVYGWETIPYNCILLFCKKIKYNRKYLLLALIFLILYVM